MKLQKNINNFSCLIWNYTKTVVLWAAALVRRQRSPAGSGAGRGSAWWCPGRDPGRRPRPVVLRRVRPSCPRRVVAAGWCFGDAAGGGGVPDGCGSSVYGGVVVPGGGWWVLCASPSRRLTVVAYFGVWGGGGRLVDGSVVGSDLLFHRSA